MTSPRPTVEASTASAATPRPEYFDPRTEFAHRFLDGQGLEIGALHLPLRVPANAEVRQVDRMTAEQLREEYPELAAVPLTEVDIIDDGERLATIADGSQDFIIANHFLEHTGDPIGTIGTHLDKLKSGGVLFYAVPDKRYTFDCRRPETPLEHMVLDHEEGPERSRRDHYDEWTLLVADPELNPADPDFEEHATVVARELEATDYSIHTHVWTQASFLALLLLCRERFDDGFEIEAMAHRGIEIVVVLRKAGAWPDPASTDPAIPDLKLGAAQREAELQGRLDAAVRELDTMKASRSWRITEPLRAAKARLSGRR